MTRRYALRDDQWERIELLLPGRKGQVGRTARDNRLFVEAVLYRYRAGLVWRDLPECLGDYRVVHLRHMRWSRKEIWQRVLEALAQGADNEYAMIDSTIVRAHQHSTGARKKRPASHWPQLRGLSTRVHATADALGNPTGFHLTAGQAHDLDGADVLLENTAAKAVMPIVLTMQVKDSSSRYNGWENRS